MCAPDMHRQPDRVDVLLATAAATIISGVWCSPV